jgi:hypothetical protein
MSPGEEPATAIVPADGQPAAAAGASSEEPIRCGRWKLKPFELPRPVILRPDGPLSLRDFLMRPDPSVVEELKSLDPEGLQQLVLARLAGAPPDMRLSLFGEPGYTIRDVVRHVQDGTPLGVRVIDAERKLVGLLLTEALTNASGFPAADLEEASRPVRSARREPSP